MSLSRASCSLMIVTSSACVRPSAGPPALAPVLAPEPSEVITDGMADDDTAAPSYADLVRQAARRGQSSEALSAHCLLDRVNERLRFVGAATPSIRPLPTPSADLDELLLRSVTVNVLTAYGRYGAASGALTLAAFSAAPPTHEAAALVVTDRGVYVRGTTASVPMQNQLTREAAVAAASTLVPGTLFVSAEADVPTPLIAELLIALGSQGMAVVLAVNLAPETILPPTSEGGAAQTCPDGLPETSDPEGALGPPQLSAPLAQLRTRAADCLGSADARAAAGGRLRLALRVDAAGAVSVACIRSDEVGDPRLRACVLGEAQKLHFPAPSPSGSVDLELPLALHSVYPPAPPLLCDGQLERELH